MASITISYGLTPAGRKASLLAKGDGKAVQTVTLTPDSLEWADAVDLADVGGDGAGKINMLGGRSAYRRVGGEVQYRQHDYPSYVAPATATQLLADYRREMALDAAGEAAHREDQAAKEEAEVARVLTCPLSDLIGTYGGTSWHVQSGPWNDPRTAARKAEAEAEAKRLTAEAEAKEKAKKAAAEAAKKAGLDKLSSWTRENGSELARFRLEDGYDCWVSAAREEYADAAAAKIAETSGLTLDDLDERCSSVLSEDRRCPTVAEIKALRAVKSALPDGAEARLVWSRYTGGDLDEDTARAEIEITIPVPGAGDETRSLVVSE